MDLDFAEILLNYLDWKEEYAAGQKWLWVTRTGSSFDEI